MKKIIIPISALFVVGLSHAQTLNLSTTENYVYTKTYLTDPTSSTPKSTESVQYLDGLGRPKQAVNIKASPLGRDVVTHFVYDQYGRQAQEYLPVPQGGTGNGAIVTSPLTNSTQPDIYGSEIIFSKKEFEASPLDRVLEQKQVGTAWSSKPVKFGYEANENGEVKKYVATFDYGSFSSTITLSSTSYGAGQLYKNIITDEDGNKTIEFKNGQGHIILVRKMLDGTTEVDTYYVYNDYGQLAYIIPPLAVAANSVDSTTLNNLCYQYKYDSRNRLVEKKLPGKGWEFMVYDKQDRLVGAQDSNLEGKGHWLFTKYDQFGRVAFTGISTGGDRLTEQADADTKGSNNMNRIENVGFTREGMDVYYSGRSYPTDTKFVKLLSVRYYDTYAPYSFNPVFPTTVFNAPVISDNITNNDVSTKSLPVMSVVKNIEDDNWTKNYTWYDSRGKAVATHSINHLGGYTKTESLLDLSGTPQQVVTKHKRVNTDIERIIVENFSYDHQNRLLTHTHQVDSNPVEYLAQNKYNELSQLENKKVGGISANSPLQQMDYKYNIRGWMTQINDPVILGGDFFGYKVKYENPVYSGIASGRFNGNIAEIDWNTSVINNLKRYTYSYDGLNRLKDAVYTDPEQTNPYSNNYNEHLTYDLNGNIKTLKRFGLLGLGAPTALMVDDLDYQYTGNRLNQIIENALNDTGYEGGNNTIPYDSNGNMINMLDKGIQGITYNHLNLPNTMSIYQSNNLVTGVYNLDYLYRADGTKLRKKYATVPGRGGSSTVKITDYLDGFHYNQTELAAPCPFCRTEVAYERDAYVAKDPILLEPIDPLNPRPPFGGVFLLDFVITAEGFYSYAENRYIYQYRDHLGNTRISFAKKLDGSVEITDTNDYYPFGLNHIGTEYKGYLGSYYNYKYNGKEIQETGMYAMDFRQYMPDLGRFVGIDKLSELAPGINPYRFAFNNPILFSDPTGLFETRQEAREYRSEHNITGGIQKNKDGTFSINDKTNHVSYTKGTEGSGENFANDGVQEAALITQKKSENNFTYNPSTIGNNIFNFSYPGGNNPKNKFDLRKDDFSYIPYYLSEYPAIGHDRRYDNLGIAGAGGLFTNTTAIGTDYKFVSEELNIALNPFSGAGGKDRLAAATLGIGLGLAALPKTLFKYSSSGNSYDFIQNVKSDYKKASQGVNNTPTGATNNEMTKRWLQGLK